MCWYHPGLHWPGEFSGIAWQSETFERGFTPPAPDAGPQGCWTFDDQRSRSPWCRKDCTCRCTSPSQSLDSTTFQESSTFSMVDAAVACAILVLHFGAWGSTFLCDGDLLPVNPLNPPGSRGRVCSFYRAIFFWVPQGQVRDFLAMLRAMMEQDDGARMVDNVGLEQLDGNHWGKRPESRDKNMSELSGVNVFWRFWTSPSSFSWRLHRLYIHNSWVMWNTILTKP